MIEILQVFIVTVIAITVIYEVVRAVQESERELEDKYKDEDA